MLALPPAQRPDTVPTWTVVPVLGAGLQATFGLPCEIFLCAKLEILLGLSVPILAMIPLASLLGRRLACADLPQKVALFLVARVGWLPCTASRSPYRAIPFSGIGNYPARPRPFVVVIA